MTTSLPLQSVPLRLKIVQIVFWMTSLLLVFAMLGSILGPRVDSQAPAIDKIENAGFAVAAIVFFLLANRLGRLKRNALWPAVSISLLVTGFFLFRVLSGHGSMIAQLILSGLFLTCGGILFFSQKFFLRC